FTAGRFLNAEHGYDPMLGAVQYVEVFNNADGKPYLDSAKHTAFTTWQEVFEATFSGTDLSKVGLYGRDALRGQGDSPGSSPSIAKGALASVITGTGSPEAIEAYGWL